MLSISNLTARVPGTNRVPGIHVSRQITGNDANYEKDKSRQIYHNFRRDYAKYMSSSDKDIVRRRDLVAYYIRLALCRKSIDIGVRDILDTVACTGSLQLVTFRVGNSQIRLLIPEDVFTVLDQIRKRIDLYCQLSTYQRLHQKSYLKNTPDLVLRLETMGVSSHEQMQLHRGLIEKHVVSSPQLEKVTRAHPDTIKKAIYPATIVVKVRRVCKHISRGDILWFE